MKIWGSADILNKKEMDLIENGMFEILSEVGFKVEHTKILNSLKEAGAIVKNDRVLFSRKWLTNFLIESKRVDIDYSGNLLRLKIRRPPVAQSRDSLLAGLTIALDASEEARKYITGSILKKIWIEKGLDTGNG